MDEDSIVILRANTVHNSKEFNATILILGDGMGGHNAGEIASYIATRTVGRFLIQRLLYKELDYLSELDLGVREANKAVLEYSKKNPECEGMGTTLVAAILIDRNLYVANVGDSRLYIINNNKKDIRQVTVDHSMGGGILTRAIGCDPKVKVDTFHAKLKKDDLILLCCDGLSDVVRNDEIKKIALSTEDPQDACDRLIELADSRGSPDNVSLILVRDIDE